MLRGWGTGLIAAATSALLFGLANAPTAGAAGSLSNGDFEAGHLTPWVNASSEDATATLRATGVGQVLRLSPTEVGTARVTQLVSVEPDRGYVLTADAAGSAASFIGVRGHQGRWTQVEGQRSVSFRTAAGVTELEVYLQAWRQQDGYSDVDNVRLLPEGSDPTPTPEPTTPAPEPTAPSSPNLVTNPGFETGSLDGWTTTGGAAGVTADGFGSGHALTLRPTPGITARVEQRVTGLAPMTLYTLALRARTRGDLWASYGVESGAQVPKSNSVKSETWVEKRFIFYTGETSREVTLYLEAYKTDSPGQVSFDEVRVVTGRLPAPDPDPGQGPWPTPPALPSLPAPGENLVANGSFADGPTGWVIDRGDVTDRQLTLTSAPDGTARAVQDIGIALTPNTDYTMRVTARSSGGQPTVGLVVGDQHRYAVVTGSQSRTFQIAVRTPAIYVRPKVLLERWKGDRGSLTVSNVELQAKGGEWLDTPSPTPKATTAPLVEDFANGLNPNRWLVVDRGWGGDNGGLAPANVSIKNGVLRLAAHGDKYTGTVTGQGGRKTRVGAGIATRDYYASGRYVIRARLPKVLGAASAFWSFHYIEEFPSQAGYWDEPGRIRNTEIDWEFPTDLANDQANDPISYSHGRANTWGGKLGGEGAHHPGRIDFGRAVADGKFHDFGIEWHSGGAGARPRVIWSLDGREVYRHEGAVFGQDNVPYRGARFWLGIWFPASGYKERINGGYVDRVGWAGNPDFDTAVLEIDRVTITPFSEPNDAWEAETWPNGWYALPHRYPR